MRPVPCPLPQLTFSVLMLVVISCTPDAAVEQQQGNPQSPQDNGETGGQDTAQNPEGTVRSLRIVTELSPSWVAWSEVEVWGSWDQEGGEVVNLTGDLQAWSSSQGSDAPYQAVDGNPDTSWNSGDFAPATLVLDLPRPAVISEVRLRVTQSPAGPTRHLLQAASSDKNYGTLTVFEDETFSGEWLVYRAPVGDIEDCPALEFSLIMEQTTQPCSDCFIWFWGMGVPEQRPRLEVDYTT